MASIFPTFGQTQAHMGRSIPEALRREDFAIGGARFDAVFLWGAPVIALVLIMSLSLIALNLPAAASTLMVKAMSAALGIMIFSHLVAVVPRAYLNPDVFRVHGLRLTVVPVLLIVAFVTSPVLLVIGMVLAIFWDVHHSAMQTFGLGRIYDMKAGNDPHTLRHVDLVLNSALYIGPIATGASLLVHFHSFDRFESIGWASLTRLPGTIAGHAGLIRVGAILLWAGIVGWSLIAYARAARAGYRISAQKKALLFTTATVSIAAWGFAPPFIAFAVVNVFHAMQYFAIVWLKEGGRIRDAVPRIGRGALPLFLAGCAGFGAAYWMVAEAGLAREGAWLAPFIACSLLHFWYDGFVWSVRRKLV